MSRASRPRPQVASVKLSTCSGNAGEGSKPRVSNDEPERMKALRKDREPRAQYMAVYPARAMVSHTAGSSTRPRGAKYAMARSRLS
jgi:hypothetical protein